MKFNETELYQSISNELAGEESERESEIVKAWLAADPKNELIYNALYDKWHNNDLEFQSEKVLARLKKRISLESNSEAAEMTLVGNPKPKMLWLKIAAILVTCFGIGYYLIAIQPTNNERISEEVNTVEKSNPRGQKSTIFLSDGTKVVLNSGSKISYAEKFSTENREVVLEGEAYFEVAKDSSRPFKVITNRITTIAIGTAFNINAYPSRENIRVSLTEGKVKIEHEKDLKGTHYLEPGQELVYSTKSNETALVKFNIAEVTSWKDGIIYFKNANHKTVFHQLEYWYGVDIILNNEMTEEWNISARFENESLDNVLTSLSYSKEFAFSIDSQKVFIDIENYGSKND